MMRPVFLVSAILFAVAAAALAQQSTTTVIVVASSNNGDRLAPEIHLFQLGSHRDFWPAGKAQVAQIPYGYYEFEASLPGFRSIQRELDLGEEHVDVRAVFLPSDEAQGLLELRGRVLHAKEYSALWVVAFPLAGSPSDIRECLVNSTGHFRLTTSHAGPYLFGVIRGEKLLSSQQVFVASQNTDLTIDLRE